MSEEIGIQIKMEYMINKFLKKALDEKTLIGIRTKKLEWGQTIIGYIVDLDATCFIINEVDEYGILIGKTLIMISDILHIECNDRYQKRLQFISEKGSIFDRNSRVTIWKEGKSLLSDLKALQGSDKICTFFLNEDDYIIGFLIDITDDQILIRGIGDEGDDDGISCYYIENFIGLRYDSLVEQRIKLLFENQAVFYK